MCRAHSAMVRSSDPAHRRQRRRWGKVSPEGRFPTTASTTARSWASRTSRSCSAAARRSGAWRSAGCSSFSRRTSTEHRYRRRSGPAQAGQSRLSQAVRRFEHPLIFVKRACSNRGRTTGTSRGRSATPLKAADQLLHDQAYLPRRLHSQPRRDAAPDGKVRPRREGDLERFVSLPPQRRPVAQEFRGELGADSCDRPAPLRREIPPGLAVLSGRRRRNLRGRARDHQLLPHYVREGPLRAPGPDHAARGAARALALLAADQQQAADHDRIECLPADGSLT